MNNNDIFKKLRVALQLRDEQIVEILQLVDFRISKSELSSFFRNENHPNYKDCGDQILRNFLNGLVIHLRGTKEQPKDPMTVIKGHAQKSDKKPLPTPQKEKPKYRGNKPEENHKKKSQVIEKVKFKNGKKKP